MRRITPPNCVLRTLLICACFVPFVPRASKAQALNFAVDSTLTTGVRRAPGPDGDAISKRAPADLNLDVGLIFDNDRTSEWGAGLTFQLEKQAAVAVSPQVRLVRGDDPWNVFLGAGVPLYVTPGTLLGLKVEGGVVFQFADAVGAMAIVNTEYFFAGGDLPKHGSVLMFNFGAGIRVLL